MSPSTPFGTVVLSCEHAGNRVPGAFAHLFRSRHAQNALNSHRGLDIGILPVVRGMGRRLGVRPIVTTVTRLLVDVNRSPRHRDLFSEFSRRLNDEERSRLIDTWYAPHRRAVEDAVRAVRSGALHLGLHSFTPVLNGVHRNVDIGLLYDPSRARERALCAAWAAALRTAAPDLRIRRNAPYRGVADGLATTLRTILPASAYLGIEVELNHSLLGAPAQSRRLARLLSETLPSR